MALPKLNTPTYELVLPSTGEKIKYRPFLVKEQKVLMIAKESEKYEDIANAVGNLVASCTFGKVNAETSPMFDIEFIFMRIRGKSIGEKVDISVLCPDDEKTRVPVKINLEEINVNMTVDHTNEVEITKDVKVIMRYPILKDMDNGFLDLDNAARTFMIMEKCVDSIIHGDKTFNRIDMTEKELTDFVDSMTTDQIDGIINFFDTMPKIRHVVEVTNPNTNKKSEVVLEGLESFLEF
tara:strand:+ start:18 stop:728 length:711 start_codon:yes stop_codon:yes gene_type:complete